jgi:RNA polymerase sigma-70 factor (ECF subfamily)
MTRRSPYEDEAALIAGMIDERPEAWRAFHASYGTQVDRTIVSVTRRFWRLLSEVDVHDARAGFYASLLANDKRKLRCFDPARGLRFGAWIKVLAIRSTLDFIRRVRRQPPRSDLDEALDVPCSSTADPHANAVRREQGAVVADLIGELSARDRELIRLHFVEQMEPLEIADRMSVSVKTVYSKKNKIIARLKVLLDRAS